MPRARPRARPAVAAAVLCGALATLATPAAWADDEFDGASVIFARGAALYRSDASGRAETEIAQLGAKVTVRALRSDAGGTVLLADLAGTWAWMPLDGKARSLIELPCADGPAQLAEDGASVLCRAPGAANRSIVVELSRGNAIGQRGAARPVALDVPPASARLTGAGADRALIWADAGGVWTAPQTDPGRKSRIAPDPPVRGFSPSPDGEHAVGVYADQVYADVRHTQPAEVLMTLQLDGQGARRKAIRTGVAVEWSHDSQWVLVQDGPSACIMRAIGGQYKCWKGFTAVSLSSDGRWGLVLGNRDGSKHQTAAKSAKPPPTKARPTRRAASPRPQDAGKPRDPGDMPWDHIDDPDYQPPTEPETADEPPAGDDVSVALPSGPLALYRVRLEGAFTDRPTLLVKVVDGAAVWVP